MEEMRKLQEAIERQRSRVNALIEHGTDNETFVRENHKLDQLIEEYIELEIQAAYQEEES